MPIRALTVALAALSALPFATAAAELPNRAAKPASAPPVQRCEIDGLQGFVTTGGICMRISGSVSAQFSAGSLGTRSAINPKP